MRRNTCLIAALAATLSSLCLGIVLAGVAIFWLPAQAELVFGPPGKEVGPAQHIALSIRLLLQADQLRLPQDPIGAPISFNVSLGESTYAISERLEDQGLIPNARALRDYLVYAGIDTTLQAGEYTLTPRMTPIEIAHNLQDATPLEVTFRILPGWRMEEIAESLPTSGLSISPESFLASAHTPSWKSALQDQLPPNATLEGFLYPDSYRLSRQISTEAFIATVLENFQAKVDPEIIQGFKDQGLDLHQAVTLASIVQREAVVEDEMPLIASVFYNRLAAGMKLDSDPTVQYALGYNATQGVWWTNPLSLADLEIDSPYNTYRYPGLPPSPIANPGLNALQAVAFPAQTPYYYFRAACDGSGRHSFAETFEEHRNNACP